MSAPTLEIVESGLFTTVQDLGRPGYQRFGVPASGAMDRFALRAANALVGNAPGGAGLEMTVVGSGITFLIDTWAALTGGDLSPRLDDEPLQAWKAFRVHAGSRLTFHGMQDGMRAYLAVAGGIDVPQVMGSRSTYVQAGFGGLEGRALRKGDTLAAFPAEGEFRARTLPGGYAAPAYGETHELRAVLGPQQEAFTPKAIETLLSSTYEISLDSDRMGYRLEGPAIEHVAGADIVSDGNPLGAIQVPGEGVPTVLLADRGTTGGYTRIATVISVDVDRLAQAVPGQAVTFATIDVEEAQQLLREQMRLIEEIAAVPPKVDHRIAVVVDGESFEVLGDGGEPLTRTLSPDPPGSGPTHRASATVGDATYEFDIEVHPGGDRQT